MDVIGNTEGTLNMDDFLQPARREFNPMLEARAAELSRGQGTWLIEVLGMRDGHSYCPTKTYSVGELVERFQAAGMLPSGETISHEALQGKVREFVASEGPWAAYVYFTPEHAKNSSERYTAWLISESD